MFFAPQLGGTIGTGYVIVRTHEWANFRSVQHTLSNNRSAQCNRPLQKSVPTDLPEVTMMIKLASVAVFVMFLCGSNGKRQLTYVPYVVLATSAFITLSVLSSIPQFGTQKPFTAPGSSGLSLLIKHDRVS